VRARRKRFFSEKKKQKTFIRFSFAGTIDAA
jgi:hypothetical protein